MSVAIDESARPLENVRAQLQAGWQIAGPAFERPAYIAVAGQRPEGPPGPRRAVELLLCAAGQRPEGPRVPARSWSCSTARRCAISCMTMDWR